jgi:hypothetical protein
LARSGLPPPDNSVTRERAYGGKTAVHSVRRPWHRAGGAGACAC